MQRHTRHWTSESMFSSPMFGTKAECRLSTFSEGSVDCEPRLRFRRHSTEAHACAGRDGAVDMDRLAPNCRSVLRPREDMTRVSIALSIRLQNRELLGSPEPQTICPQRAIVLVLFACAVVSVAVPAYRPWPLFLGLPHIILAV